MRLKSLALALAFVACFVSHVRSQGAAAQVYGPGQGVTNPSVLLEAKPEYTQDAMKARIQGVVEVEAVIRADGTVGEARVVKSLDTQFGLDAQALAAARKWRFRPAMVQGQAVPFKVIIQLEFKLGMKSTTDEEFMRGVIRPRPETPGLVLPKVKSEAKPKYTPEAMRRNVQGVVEVEAVVGVDGKVERARISKSLDKEFGLDEEALRAAGQWTFEPGTLHGAAVPVVVIIQLEFRR